MERREFRRDDRVYRDRNRGGNWLWLIPLLMLPLIAWGAWRAYDNAHMGTNQAYNLTSPEPQNNGASSNGNTNYGSTDSGLPNTGGNMNGSSNTTVGVGGGPGDLNNTTPSRAPDTGMGGMSD